MGGLYQGLQRLRSLTGRRLGVRGGGLEHGVYEGDAMLRPAAVLCRVVSLVCPLVLRRRPRAPVFHHRALRRQMESADISSKVGEFRVTSRGLVARVALYADPGPAWPCRTSLCVGPRRSLDTHTVNATLGFAASPLDVSRSGPWSAVGWDGRGGLGGRSLLTRTTGRGSLTLLAHKTCW